MKTRLLANCAAAALLSCSLSACFLTGDDGNGMAPTPAPPPTGSPAPSPSPSPGPSPSPSPSPTPTAGGTAAEILGYSADTSIEAATSFFAVRPPQTIYGEQDAEAFGEGTQIDYNAGADSYTFTRSDGLTVTVTPDDIDEDGQFEGEGGLFGSCSESCTAYVVENGDITHTVAIAVPQSDEEGGLFFQHLAVSLWNVQDTSGQVPENELQWQIWGNQTQSMPTSGTATYSLDGGIGANGFDPDAGPMNAGAAYDFLNGESTGELGIDFASGAIEIMMNLIGFDYVAEESRDFGDFAASGAITSGAQYEGTFDAGGEFYGAFFGPDADETGFTFFIDSSDVKVTGVAIGTRD